MPEENDNQPAIVGKPVSELTYEDFKPYIDQYIVYATIAGENGERIPTEIVAIGTSLPDEKPRSGTGLIKLLEEGNWRNFDFLIGKK